jgi:exodeoxyribonuclease V beta subunit
MTRAVHALHVYWVERKGFPADGEPPDALACEVAAIDLLIARAQRRHGLAPGEASLPALAARLRGVAIAPALVDASTVYEAPAAPRREHATQAPSPALRAFEWQHSFSAIARGATVATAVEAGASDEGGDGVGEAEAAPEPAGDDPRLLALQALRGPRFGDAVHRMFELATPEPLWPTQRGLVVRELMARGLRAPAGTDIDPVEAIARMIDRSRNADLGEGLRLGEVGADARVSEFEFQLPLRHVPVARVRALCAAHGHADAVPAALDAQRLNGMLTGFVDLVFEWRGRYHVLDYKTNWLGSDVAGYRGTGLDAAMRSHHYPLQALLYSVAVHRYLRQRLAGYEPAHHLGESWYLFVRALGLAPGAGVWRRQWPGGLIESLDGLFAGSTERAA